MSVDEFVKDELLPNHNSHSLVIQTIKCTQGTVIPNVPFDDEQ